MFYATNRNDVRGIAVKKVLSTVLVVFILGAFLRVPLASVTNGSFRKGEIAALQQSFMNATGMWKGESHPCSDLILSASGIMAVDTLDIQQSTDWLAGCQYVQD